MKKNQKKSTLFSLNTLYIWSQKQNYKIILAFIKIGRKENPFPILRIWIKPLTSSSSKNNDIAYNRIWPELLIIILLSSELGKKKKVKLEKKPQKSSIFDEAQRFFFNVNFYLVVIKMEQIVKILPNFLVILNEGEILHWIDNWHIQLIFY